ncbi:MAG: barstar family protein [Terriglobales bacterium]
MGKLLQRLSDATKSGVYRAAHDRDVADALQGSALRLARIDLSGITANDAMLARIAGALDFPPWFGGNWDALEDCLSDLSWSNAGGHVLLFEGATGLPADARGILIDILASAAASWKDRGRPFFAVFLGAALPLPELYKPRTDDM